MLLSATIDLELLHVRGEDVDEAEARVEVNTGPGAPPRVKLYLRGGDRDEGEESDAAVWLTREQARELMHALRMALEAGEVRGDR